MIQPKPSNTVWIRVRDGGSMFPQRRFVVAVSALSLIAGVFVLASVADARAQGASGRCEDAAELAVLPSPIAPWKGAPLRVIFAAEKPLEGELSLIGPDGRAAATSRERLGGPPYFWFVEVASPAAGKWQAKLTRDGAPSECGTIAREIVVSATKPPSPHAVQGSVWPVRGTWSRANENLYSAWIEKLFDAPLDASLSWKALHEVLRDRSRNLLFNHLGLGEDQTGTVIRPDCADLPYFLRAYFAFKMGLPFGYSKCTRGTATEPPKCHAWWNIQNEEPRPVAPPPQQQMIASATPFEMFRQRPTPPGAMLTPPGPRARPPGPPPRPPGLAAGFGHYLQHSIADGVHSGAGRTRATDD